jgi:hypothetical protein
MPMTGIGEREARDVGAYLYRTPLKVCIAQSLLLPEHEPRNRRGTASPTYRPPQPRTEACPATETYRAYTKAGSGETRAASWQERLADANTRFTGSRMFVCSVDELTHRAS